MTPEQVTFVNTTVVPWGLIAIMFSLGLSLTIEDFGKTLRHPRAVIVGLAGQMLLLPLLGFSVVVIFALPPSMAIGLIVLAVCPGGVTSNAISFAIRANVALSVAMTAIASLITVFTTPYLVSLALQYFSTAVDVPAFSIIDTVIRLAKITAGPIVLGMLVRAYLPDFSQRLIVWLRPASLVVLIAVIVFSLVVSAEMVLDNLVTAGPAAYVLNALALFCGFLLAKWAGLNAKDTKTVAIEVGIQNVTVATFLTLSIMNDLELAITPTIYGAIMMINTVAFLRILGARNKKVGIDQVEY